MQFVDEALKIEDVVLSFDTLTLILHIYAVLQHQPQKVSYRFKS